jgi:hypothetical protein
VKGPGSAVVLAVRRAGSLSSPSLCSCPCFIRLRRRSSSSSVLTNEYLNISVSLRTSVCCEPPLRCAFPSSIPAAATLVAATLSGDGTDRSRSFPGLQPWQGADDKEEWDDTASASPLCLFLCRQSHHITNMYIQQPH